MVWSGLATGVGAYSGANNSYDLPLSPLEGSVFWTAVNHSAYNLIDRGTHKITGGKDAFRWSLFNGPQLDRAVALKAMAKTRTLVKEIK